MVVLLHRCCTARLVPAAHLHISYAKDILAPVYDRFTEGFATADMRTMRAPLDSLPQRLISKPRSFHVSFSQKLAWPEGLAKSAPPLERTFHNRPLCETDLPVILCPSLDGAPETQRSYRLGDLGRILLVGISAPAGMTDRNVLDVMPRAFASSNIPQCDYPPPLKLKASSREPGGVETQDRSHLACAQPR
jgi:hypothetical protein